MKAFAKCEICDVKVPADKCVFATHKGVIDGKEYIYCCMIMQQKQAKKGKNP